MQLKNNRKGFAYITIMVIIVIVLLVSIIVVVMSKQGKFRFKRIGDIQLNALETYQNAEKTLFLIDQAAKYSAYESIHELAEEGGLFREAEGCGDHLGYTLLYDSGEFCDSNLEEEFKEVFSKNLDTYIPGMLPVNSFLIEILGTGSLEVVGVSRNILEFPISYTTEKPIEKKELCEIPVLVEPEYNEITCQEMRYGSCEFKPEILERLKKAQDIARREGVELIITNAFRTYDQQARLREKYGTSAAPPRCSAPHIMGLAVDVVLKGKSYMSREGASISDMSFPERQLLEKIMCEAGFVRWNGEFWHYEYGSERWEKGTEAGVCAWA
ncbi:D-alanyl-D-alanine carboxypeptidase family protein [Candidatus Woesearchaeota archaeon]|nr:D-alanyl-D-alanine carboxypeptidase family protein [Candidatus Woesearchaeota archaeon]